MIDDWWEDGNGDGHFVQELADFPVMKIHMLGFNKIWVGVFAIVSIGCGERSLEKPVVRNIGSYRFSESIVDDSGRRVQVDIVRVDGDRQSPVGHLFVGDGMVVTVAPTPGQSDVVRPVAGYASIEMLSRFVDEFSLVGGGRLYRGRLENLDIQSSVDLLAEKELPDHDEKKTALLIIMQGAPYDVFLESFELLADGYDRVGVGFHIPPY
jgi:hypothetical protein